MLFRVSTIFLIAEVFSQAAAPQSAFITYLIASAEAKIKASPARAEGYSDLAFALARRARETEDPAYWKRAEEAINKALKLDPRNFDARKARVLVRLQEGRFGDAEEEATALNKQTPDDNPLYGYLADVALGEGRYDVAEALSQRMLDLRQVNGPGLQRAAQVREAIGFPEGAGEFWLSSLRLASSGDTEERAYLLTQVAGFSRRQGKLDDAGRYLGEALSVEPDYPAALIEQARVALERDKSEDALAPLEKRLQQSESVAALYWNFQALKTHEAGARFLQAAQQLQGKPGNRDDLLVRYLTAEGRAAEAVKVGAGTARKNLEMLDAYALALLAAGQTSAAREQMDKLLHWGVRDPAYFLDAAEVCEKAGDAECARTNLTHVIETNGNSRYAKLALQKLRK